MIVIITIALRPTLHPLPLVTSCPPVLLTLPPHVIHTDQLITQIVMILHVEPYKIFLEAEAQHVCCHVDLARCPIDLSHVIVVHEGYRYVVGVKDDDFASDFNGAMEDGDR